MKRICAFAVLAVVLVCFVVSCGRTQSRYLGKDYRQVLEVENMQQFVSLSFHADGSSTIKDVTFLASDGYVYTQEFKDTSPLEGMIRWVPINESDSMIQSRGISRWTGKPVNLKLPADCSRVLEVSVSNISKSERVKNLVYLSTDGRILAKEYQEGLIDRHFEGWLEIKAKKS